MVNSCPLVYKAPIDTLDAIGTEMARPTKYSPALQKKADDYINNLPEGQIIHSIEGLALHLGIHRDTCYAWRDTIEEFSDTLDKVMKMQAIALINNGLSGEYNSTITKMMMNVNHGYRERTETDHTSSDGSMSPQKIERVIVEATQV